MSEATAQAAGLDNGHELEVTLEGPMTLSPEIRAEVDIQISTAKRFPRDLKSFKNQALAMATFDEETAAGCFYSLPRGGKPIEGPSARLAEIVLSAWGNVRADAKVVAVNDKYLTAEAMTWDLEKNVAIRVQVQRRITDKNNRRYSDDMIVVTGNAACSIALRNSVFKVIPMVYTKSIYQSARQVAIGSAETLSAKRAQMVDYFGKMGITPERVFAAIDKASIEEIGLDELAVLKGAATAIKDGDVTVDEVFPPITPDGNGSSGIAGLKDRLTKKDEPKPAEATKTESPTEKERPGPPDLENMKPGDPVDFSGADAEPGIDSDESRLVNLQTAATEIYRGLKGEDKSKAEKFLGTKGLRELSAEKLGEFLEKFSEQ